MEAANDAEACAMCGAVTALNGDGLCADADACIDRLDAILTSHSCPDCAPANDGLREQQRALREYRDRVESVTGAVRFAEWTEDGYPVFEYDRTMPERKP